LLIQFFSSDTSSPVRRAPLGGMLAATATRSIMRESWGRPGTTMSASIMRETSSAEPQPAGSAWL
jgi:hypothetical protein